MNRLHTQLWMAPQDPGPTLRYVLGLQVAVALLLVTWVLLPAGVLRSVSEGKPRQFVIVVAEDGSAQANGVSLDTQVRDRGGTKFLVVTHQLGANARPVELQVEAPPSVDPQDIAIRRILPHGGRSGRDGEVLVTVPLRSLAEAEQDGAAPPLEELTGPFDARAADVRSDLRIQQQLQRGWWWIVPFVFLVGTWLPLWLWRRRARSFFAMRLPGPGKEFGAEPPSSLDPVGAAVLRAGVGQTDYVAAFLGSIFDLVERRSLDLRRTSDEAFGGAGALFTLPAPGDELGADAPAIALLRSTANEDSVTVPIPDLPDDLRPVSTRAWGAWQAHVDARARFERVVDTVDSSRLTAATAAFASFALVSVAGLVLVDYDGQRAGALIAALLTFPAALTCGRWLRDARRWRIVRRERRNERAQWLAWRRVIGTQGGPQLELAQLPVVMATGLVQGLIHDTAGPNAVGLDAITGSTLRSMRGMIPGSDRG